MIIINFKEAYDKDYWVLNGIDLYNDRKSVNFERNVDISLFGKTLFVEPTNSSEIKKTLEELKKEITEKKESEKTLLDRIDQTIKNIENFKIDTFKRIPDEFKNELSYVEKK